MNSKSRGLVIAGTHSGVGKTTVALGIMAALRRRGLRVQAFKVGPDFIDPGHHTHMTGRPSRNLDGWMLSKEENLAVFQRHGLQAEVAIVEGVMGLFDGYDGLSEAGSTAQIAKWLGLPVLLVVDARAMARSAGALVHGFATFDLELPLAGVVFNRIGSRRHLEYLVQVIDQLGEVRCLGGIPRESELVIPERHLGLMTREEHELGSEYQDHLAGLMEECLDLEALWKKMPEITLSGAALPPAVVPMIRLGVARDRAFCFYYPENLEWLAHYGAELIPFSPLGDGELPARLDGLYLGGGYPEVFVNQLAANRSMRASIRQQAEAGLPIYAECGGLMYLSQEIQDLEGQSHLMVGLLPLQVRMLPRLKSLGYREVTLTTDSLLGSSGTVVRGHEFHYSEIVAEPTALQRVYRLSGRQSQPDWAEGYVCHNVLASYVHLHFGSNPKAARQLVEYCRLYRERK